MGNSMKNLEIIENKMLDLGFSSREAKVYTILFHKKDFTAVEVQQLVDIPRTKVYEVLHKLISKGFCTEKIIGRNKKYEVVNPHSSFNILLQQYKEDITQKENSVNSAIEILSSIFEQRKENDNPLDYIEVIKDSAQIHDKWISFLKSAKKEVIGFTKGPYTNIFGVGTKIEIDAMRRGVTFMSIYEYQDISKPDFLNFISSWAEAGEQVRVSDSLPIKMNIFDESIAMFALNDPISSTPSITTMIVRHKSFATVLKHVFYSYWEQATLFDEFKTNGLRNE